MSVSKIIKYIAAIIFTALVVFYGWFWYRMSTPSCSDTLLSESQSPEGDYVIGFFEGNCGATTEYVYHINFRKKNESFVTENTGMVVSNQICGSSDKAGFRVLWQSPKKLVVETKIDKEQLNCIDKFDNVSVEVRSVSE